MYRTTNLQNERLLNLCTAVIPCMQAISLGLVLILHSLCVSAHFCIKNKLAFKLFCTSWMKMPCTELTCFCGNQFPLSYEMVPESKIMGVQ